MPLVEDLRAELARLEQRGLRRRARPVDTAQGPLLRVDGIEALNFSSNNYLGLAADPRLAQAAHAAQVIHGSGSGASRLIAGNQIPHRQLEQRLATLFGGGALVFNSGYQANVGLLSALAGPEAVVFSDALNHASLIDGCRLARARVEVFAHRDLGDLDRRLTQARGVRRKLIVTDSLFSMDGDLADLPGLRALADAHDAALLIDEAHALGVLGPRGLGLAAITGTRSDALMATFGKALGAFGAFVAGDQVLVEWLLNRARSFIFTTALPPGVMASAEAGLVIATGPEGDQRREDLHARIRQFAEGLRSLQLLAPGAGETPIFPIHVGEDHAVMAVSQGLLEAGIFAQGIRPPTVPPGTARLRFALMATHEPAHVDRALEALELQQRRGLLPSAAP